MASAIYKHYRDEYMAYIEGKTAEERESVFCILHIYNAFTKKNTMNMAFKRQRKSGFIVFFQGMVIFALFVIHIRNVVPSVTPVLSTQMSWIGRHFSRSCGGGYCFQQKSINRIYRKQMKVCLEPDGGSKKMKEKKYMQWTIETEKNEWKNTPRCGKREKKIEKLKLLKYIGEIGRWPNYGKIINWKKTCKTRTQFKQVGCWVAEMW